jgi:hypothetical protein
MAEIGRRKRDAALLLALASGQTIRDAARAAGIGERTATRRVADPEFRRLIAQTRNEMTNRALGRITDAMTAAADTLRALLNAEAESVRLAAARTILELPNKMSISLELAEQLEELKQRYEQSTGRTF